MTDDTEPTGRALDVWLFKHLKLGEVRHDNAPSPHSIPRYWLVTFNGSYHPYRVSEDAAWLDAPSYHLTDWSLLCEAMRKRGWTVLVKMLPHESNAYTCEVCKWFEEGMISEEAEGDTPGEAVARACYRALRRVKDAIS